MSVPIAPLARRPNASVRALAPAVEPTRVALNAFAIHADFGGSQVLRNVSLAFHEREVTAIIGPSGCGKSTLLRCLNRMHETTPGAGVSGRVEFYGADMYGTGISATDVRRHIGMVFQRPTPFPTLSIRDNVSAGVLAMARHQRPNRAATAQMVEQALRDAALWDEVKDRLDTSAIGLSGGQQQRLCIARALANAPAVLLFDEPTASLDPLSTQKIEELIYSLRQKLTVVIVTHNMQQAARVSNRTAFMLDGELVEVALTGQLFTAPTDARTEAFITGRFG